MDLNYKDKPILYNLAMYFRLEAFFHFQTTKNRVKFNHFLLVLIKIIKIKIHALCNYGGLHVFQFAAVGSWIT